MHLNFALEKALLATLAEFENVEANAISLIKSKLNTSEAIDLWHTDSACSAHITPRRDWFAQYEPISEVKMNLGDNSTCDTIGKDTILIKRWINGKWCDGCIENELHVPSFKKNPFLYKRVNEKWIPSDIRI